MLSSLCMRAPDKFDMTVGNNFEYFLNQALSPFAILTGEKFIFTFANAAYIQLMSGRELIGKSLEDAIPELEGQQFISLLQKVYITGVPYHVTEIAATALFAGDDQPSTRYFNLSYTPFKNRSGVTEGILASGYDVTEQVKLKKKQEKQVLDLQAYDLFMATPVAFALTRGPEHIMELANTAFLELTGRNASIIGKSIAEIFPEIATQGYLKLLNQVLNTRETIFLNESPVTFLKNGTREDMFVNMVLQPYFEDKNIAGILSIFTEVTDQVFSRKNVEESEERLRLATETTRLGTWEFLPQTGKLTWSDECKRIYQFPLDKEVNYELFSEHIFPDDKDFAQNAIEKAMDPSGPGSYDIEYRILRFTDKSVRWIRAQGKVFFYESKPVKFIGTVLDITEAKIKEEILRLNEQRLRLAVESGRLGTYELDVVNSKIIYSARLAEIFGFAPNTKKTHEDLRNALHPDDAHIRDEAHETAKKTGYLFYEARVLWQDKSVHWVRLNGNVVFDKLGNALRIYGTVLDITEQKEKEKLLKESQEKFELIADAIPHMIWEIEMDGKISYINKQWMDWSGLSLDDINNGGWSSVIHPDDLEKVANGWAHAFENKVVYIGECRFKNPGGGYSWFTLKTTPVRKENGEIKLWIGTATDIHDKKIIEQHKDEFISMASHELKTPVTTIKAYAYIAESILEAKGDEQTLAIIKKMGNQVNKLTELIEDLLDITKIQQGKLVYKDSAFDINELIKEVVDDMQKTSATHKIKMQLDATAIVNSDKDKLGQIINNFISNAIKYSPKADNIIVRSQLKRDGIELSVQDFGIGISKREQRNIFKQFYRVSDGTQSTFPGMGIGLFICAEIIARLGGRIWLESTVDKGSVFYAWLPFNHNTPANG
ncbi:PAS domain-containing protein [Ginsengibacter hankyongi]|uniref:histidine kinase n=1 Tax=Ginsengibacter hankyongi TaxID=2607284 RepID=A0A5J5IB51_9BACT|nr:PAS domain-containing protein [Ginsengibacter hankyongi]KAA9035893.1 PAS domain-containing protein [Ginsengibacter hankyongi]